jgi:hypothetical protein
MLFIVSHCSTFVLLSQFIDYFHACSRHPVSCGVRYVVQITEVQRVRKERLSLEAGTTRLCDDLINTTSV